MYSNKLFGRDDARRLSRTLVGIRAKQGEQQLADVAGPAIRRMATLPANMLAKYAGRPVSERTVVLTAAKPNVVVFRFSCGR